MAFGIALLLWTTLYQDENAYFRGLGVVAVLMLVGSLSLPVAARLRGLPERVEADAAAGGTEVMCPGCGHVQTVALGQIRCQECHVTFRVEFV